MFEILWVGYVAYSFNDKTTGKPVTGSTKKAVVLRHDEKGNVIGVDICKMSEDPATSEEVFTGAIKETLFYDRFGRIIGGR